MKLYFFFFFFLLTGLLCGQTLKVDTIDYSLLLKISKKPYHLLKVTDGAKQIIKTTSEKYYIFLDKADSISYVNWFKTLDAKIQLGDTVISTEWDMQNGDKFLGQHKAGVMNLNKMSNIFTVQECIWGWTLPNKGPITRKFKFLKLTSNEIIILDLTYLQKKRLYYFR